MMQQFKDFVLMSILSLMISFCGFSQLDSTETVIYSDRCECLADVYAFKKEFIENVSYSEDLKFTLNPAFIEKHHFTWEKYQSIDKLCADLKQDTEKPDCLFDQLILELSEEFELIRRVIMMNSSPESRETN